MNFIRLQHTFLQLLLTLLIFNLLLVFQGHSQAPNSTNEYYNYSGAHPNQQSHLFWGDNDALTDGITHDDNNWYITTLGTCAPLDFCWPPGGPNGNWSIRRIPVGHDLNDGYQAEEWVKSNDPRLGNYGHAGDLDHCKHNGIDYLVVPITGGPYPAIAFFTTNPIHFINYAYLDPNYQTNVGWCAVNPTDGKLYTSRDDADRMLRYNIDWGTLLNPNSGNWHYTLTFDQGYHLKNTIHNMQGGEFTSDGSKLYISSGIFHEQFNDLAQYPEDGINVFNTSTWLKIKRSSNERPGRGRPAESSCFDYTFDSNNSVWSQEPEGLTIWDLDDGRAPNVSGQLHVLLYDHGYPGANAVSLKHYKYTEKQYDEYASALVLNPCEKLIVNNYCAVSALASDNIPDISGYPGAIKDVWFMINQPDTPSFSIETFPVTNGLSNTVMQLLSYSNNTFTEIAHDDNSGSGGHAKITITNYTGPWPLYVRVCDYGGNNNGQFGLYYKQSERTSASSNLFTQSEFISGDGSMVHQYPMFTGDINGDGKTDLIFEGQDWNGNTNLNVRVKMSNGDGTYTPYSQALGDGSMVHQYPMLTGDINGDGKTDLIFEGQDWNGNTNLNVRVKMSNGDGTFTAYSQVLGDGSMVHQYPMLTGDINGDGKTDLIFEGQDWNGNTNLNVRVKMSNGDGSFTPYSQILGDGVGVHQYPMLTGDINGDGKTDLIFVGKNWSGPGLNVRTKMSNGDGTFTAYSQVLGDDESVLSNRTLVGDVNGDGKTDLIFIGQNWSGPGLNIRTKMSNGDGTFTSYSQDFSADGGGPANDTLTGDVNGDGRTDLIFVGQNWNGCGLNIRVKISNGDGTWCSQAQTLGDDVEVNTYPTLIGDVNGDGKTDLVFEGQDWNGNTNLNIRTKFSQIMSCNNHLVNPAPGNPQFTIYPNPASDYFSIETPFPRIINVKIFNSLGALVNKFTNVSSDEKFNLSTYSNGIYFIQIVDLISGEKVVKKLIKIH